MNLILKLEQFEQALAEIKKVKSIKDHETIKTHEGFIAKLQQMVKAQAVRLHLERAEKNYDNEKNIIEKDMLFGAYSKIKTSNLSNEDLKTAALADYVTGDTLTLERVEQRLAALGWKG